MTDNKLHYKAVINGKNLKNTELKNIDTGNKVLFFKITVIAGKNQHLNYSLDKFLLR